MAIKPEDKSKSSETTQPKTPKSTPTSRSSTETPSSRASAQARAGSAPSKAETPSSEREVPKADISEQNRPGSPSSETTAPGRSSEAPADSSNISGQESETRRSPEGRLRDTADTSDSGLPHAGAATHTDQVTPKQDPAGDPNPPDSLVVHHPDSPLSPDSAGSLPASFRDTDTGSSFSETDGPSPSRSPLERSGLIPRSVIQSDQYALHDYTAVQGEHAELQQLLDAATANPHLVTDALERAERREANDRNIAKMNERQVAQNELLARGTAGAVFDSPLDQRRALEQQ